MPPPSVWRRECERSAARSRARRRDPAPRRPLDRIALAAVAVAIVAVGYALIVVLSLLLGAPAHP